MPRRGSSPPWFKVNPEVAALIGRMLAKAPASRPTMEQLVTELAALRATGLADGPLAQRPSLSRANGKRTGETLDAALVISAELAKVMEPGGPTPTGSGAGQVRSSTNPRRARLPVLLAAAAVVAGLVALWSATRPPSSMPKQLAATPALPGAPGPAGVVVRGAAPPDGGSQLKPPPVVVTAPPTDPSGVPASPTAPMDPAANPGSTKEGKRAGKSPRKAVRGPKSEHDKEPEKDNEKEKYKIDLWQ
jgi:hypothetical protein